MNKRIGKLTVLVIITVAMAYYGYMGVKCLKHYQALMDNRITTINLNIND